MDSRDRRLRGDGGVVLAQPHGHAAGGGHVGRRARDAGGAEAVGGGEGPPVSHEAPAAQAPLDLDVQLPRPLVDLRKKLN